MKRPRHRCFPAEVQWGNGEAKILAAEKLGKAVGRSVMQSPDGFFLHVGSSAANCQGELLQVRRHSDVKAHIALDPTFTIRATELMHRATIRPAIYHAPLWGRAYV